MFFIRQRPQRAATKIGGLKIFFNPFTRSTNQWEPVQPNCCTCGDHTGTRVKANTVKTKIWWAEIYKHAFFLHWRQCFHVEMQWFDQNGSVFRQLSSATNPLHPTSTRPIQTFHLSLLTSAYRSLSLPNAGQTLMETVQEHSFEGSWTFLFYLQHSRKWCAGCLQGIKRRM